MHTFYAKVNYLGGRMMINIYSLPSSSCYWGLCIVLLSIKKGFVNS
ncbi:hypothetical protein PEPS_42220 (plasmid) [Persicobacter psychrovividus]|uniref:Uncharacterized protein n=1 Tax=Persicobacter psychrovividus TaxID=387638 RepID=A0ABN6LFS5_9BACT|nr:hypothetical protein PEPS_42220 [Persicobacter psychrovividus]